MPNDPIPTPNPNPPKKPHQTKGPIDQRLADQLSSDHQVIDDALDEINNDPALAAALATHFLDANSAVPINAANLQALSDQAAAAEEAGAKIVQESSGARDVTQKEGGDKNKAIAAVRKIQSAAKEKYEEMNKEKLGAYYVAQRLDSRLEIQNAATACWNMIRTTDDSGNPVTPQDTLSGFGAT